MFSIQGTQAVGKVPPLIKACSNIFPVLGSGRYIGARESLIASHVSMIIFCTVDTPSLKHSAKVLNESPVDKKLKK